MKLSFMSFTCPEATLAEFLGYAQKHGYEGVEPRAEANHAHGVEVAATEAQRAEIRRTFAEAGVACGCIATSRSYCFAEKPKRDESVAVTRHLVELAADLGCNRLRVFGGMPPQGMSLADAIQVGGESLGEVGPFAEQHGVVVCLETHDGFMRADDCAAAIRVADSPAIRANWDIMHPYTKGMTIDEAYAALKGLVCHCHVHDGTYKDGKPTLALMGEGEIPHNRAVELLQADGYDGYLSGEYINAWSPDEVLPHEARVLRGYMQ